MMETNNTKLLLGQRVLITRNDGTKEIGTVVEPKSPLTRTIKTTYGVWVFSPSRRWVSDYDPKNVQPLPNGQL